MYGTAQAVSKANFSTHTAGEPSPRPQLADLIERQQNVLEASHQSASRIESALDRFGGPEAPKAVSEAKGASPRAGALGALTDVAAGAELLLERLYEIAERMERLV